MTCGYVCPQCEGKGVLESGESCDYCSKPIQGLNSEDTEEIKNQDGTEGKA
jgi:hypothetical protein